MPVYFICPLIGFHILSCIVAYYYDWKTPAWRIFYIVCCFIPGTFLLIGLAYSIKETPKMLYNTFMGIGYWIRNGN